MATYAKSPTGDIVLMLTPREAKGLAALAGEGAGIVFLDADASKAYLGGPVEIAATYNALQALQSAAA